MKAIYHNRDLDGFTSGAIIKLKYPDAEMIGYDYGQPFNVKADNSPVIMADVSLPMKDMLQLARDSNWGLTWVDHHVSAIKDYKEFVGDGESFCNAVLENGIAACEGTWKYLFPQKPMPLSVKLLGEYDTWRNTDAERWENEILPFQYGMRLICNSVETFPVDLFDNDSLVLKIIESGKVVLRYQDQTSALQCKVASFEYVFDGMRAICFNGGGLSSDFFKSVYSEDKHDIMVMFRFNGKHWVVSLYTTKDNVDCSVIAKRYGGGGHKKASGFQTRNIGRFFPDVYDSDVQSEQCPQK